jgi:phosphohistidine phosphatase
LIQDSKRRLTPKGKRNVKKIAKAMRNLELEFDLILSSPYTRARQTAEIVLDKFKGRSRLELSDLLTPGGNSKHLLGFLNGKKSAVRNVLLVGHEPYLSSLISLLMAGDSSLSVVMKKGGLCKLCSQALNGGRSATLQWLLTPGQLKLMA